MTRDNHLPALGSLILVMICLFGLVSPAQAGLGYGRQAPPAPSDVSADEEDLSIGERIQRQERALQKDQPDLTNQAPTPPASSDLFGSWWTAAALLTLTIAAVAAVIRAARKPFTQSATGPGGR